MRIVISVLAVLGAIDVIGISAFILFMLIGGKTEQGTREQEEERAGAPEENGPKDV